MKKIILVCALSFMSINLVFSSENQEEIISSYPLRVQVTQSLREIWTHKESVEDYHAKAKAFLEQSDALQQFVKTNNAIALRDSKQASPMDHERAQNYFLKGVEERGQLKDRFVKAFYEKKSLESFVLSFKHNGPWDDLKAEYAEHPNHQLFMALIDHWKRSFEGVGRYQNTLYHFQNELRSNQSKRSHDMMREYLNQSVDHHIKEGIKEHLGRFVMLYHSNTFFNDIEDFWNDVLKTIDS